MEILEIIRPLCLRINPVGSRVTCNPPPTDTDADYLCLVKRTRWVEFRNFMDANEADLGGSHVSNDMDFGDSEDEFYSFRLGELNVIASVSEVFTRRFLAASSVAKRLNLMVKADRVALFQAVLYGNGCNSVDFDPDLIWDRQ